MSPHATSLRLALLIVTVAACAGARAQPPQVWSTLAAEGQPFTVQGTRTVRYGAGDHWVAKSVTGAGECSNAWFGTDPAYMVAKTCEVQVAAGAPTGGAASVSKAAALPPATGTLSGMEIALFSTTGGTKPFTIGQALRQGDVARDKTVTADVPSVQCIVKNRWPDGTLKFVILSGQADLTANTWRRVRLAVAEHPGAEPAISVDALKSAGTTASIQFAPFGTAEWFPADWDKPVQTWIAGPQMSSFVYRKPIGTDPHLVAWLEVRVYRGGSVEVLPWVENGYLNVGRPGEKSGMARFTLGSTERFAQPLQLLNHQRAVLASGTTLTHWQGSDPHLTARHSASYLMATKLVPNYLGVTPNGSRLYTRLPDAYTPLAQASFSPDMPMPGYEPGIGLLPEWEVAYLTTGADPRAGRAVVINGYAAGRYGIHYRDENTHRPIVLASHADLVMNREGAGVSHVGSSSTERTTPPNAGPEPPVFDSPHHPSMGYMAYLLTGRQYFLEEAQFLATANFLKQNNTTRQGAKGIFETTAGANTVRGAAWAIRTLAQAAAITPDTDVRMRAQFVGSLDENIAYYHARYIARPANPFGLVQPYSNYNSGDPWSYAIWMDDFFTATFGYLKDLQAHSPSMQPRLEAFLAWKYRAVVGRLGSGAPGTYNYRYAAQYTMNYAPRANADFADGTGPWYADWGMLAASMNIPPADGGTSLQGTSGSDPANMATGFWGNLIPALAYAVDDNAPGAAAAWDRLTGAPNFNAAQFNDTPVWGVKPRSR